MDTATPATASASEHGIVALVPAGTRRYTTLEASPIAGSLGAEITGIDLSQPLSPEQVADIRAAYARNCILARRLVEQGVRFVQLFNGAYASGGELNWDGHSKLKEQYDRHAAILDQPAAALIKEIGRAHV